MRFEMDAYGDTLKSSLEEWIIGLGTSEPVARWVSASVEELGFNHCGDIEIRIHRIGSTFIVLTKDPTYINLIDCYLSFSEVTEHMGNESYRGNPEDGWEFFLREFNKLPDRYEELPDSIRRRVSSKVAIALLMSGDDDVREWIFD